MIGDVSGIDEMAARLEEVTQDAAKTEGAAEAGVTKM